MRRMNTNIVFGDSFYYVVVYIYMFFFPSPFSYYVEFCLYRLDTLCTFSCNGALINYNFADELVLLYPFVYDCQILGNETANGTGPRWVVRAKM